MMIIQLVLTAIILGIVYNAIVQIFSSLEEKYSN